MMNTTNDDNSILEQLRYDVFRHLLPVIISMILFGLAGIIGNIFAFIFYAFKSKRSSTVILIACLSMADLLVCVLFIPNIIEMWVNVRYTASFMCKLVHFIGLCTVACSGLILWVVAIDRHRKICSPFGKQLTLVTTKYAIISIVVFSFFLSIRNFANFDSVEVKVKDSERNVTVSGRYCTTRDDTNYIASVTVFTVIDFLLMLMVWLTLGVAYSHIIYTIFKLKKKRKSLHSKPRVKELNINNSTFETDEMGEQSTHSRRGNDSSVSNSGIEKGEEHTDAPLPDTALAEHLDSDRLSILDNEANVRMQDEDKQDLKLNISTVAEELNKGSDDSRKSATSGNSVASTSTSSGKLDTRPSYENTDDFSSSYDAKHLPEDRTPSTDSHSKSKKHKGFHFRRKPRRYNSAKCAVERNLTFKMLTVSIVFIACFTPYFIVKILMREVLQSGEEYELNIWAQISLRLPYMNSVFNPIVYCVFNPQFRLFVKNVFLGLFSKCLGKTKYLFNS